MAALYRFDRLRERAGLPALPQDQQAELAALAREQVKLGVESTPEDERWKDEPIRE